MTYQGRHRGGGHRSPTSVNDLRRARDEIVEEHEFVRDLRRGGGEGVRRLDRPAVVWDIDPVARAVVDPEQLRAFAEEHNMTLDWSEYDEHPEEL